MDKILDERFASAKGKPTKPAPSVAGPKTAQRVREVKEGRSAGIEL